MDISLQNKFPLSDISIFWKLKLFLYKPNSDHMNKMHYQNNYEIHAMHAVTTHVASLTLIEHLYFVISDKYIVKGKQHAKTPR